MMLVPVSAFFFGQMNYACLVRVYAPTANFNLRVPLLLGVRDRFLAITQALLGPNRTSVIVVAVPAPLPPVPTRRS